MGRMIMVSHFQWKPLFKQLPGWKIRFYSKGVFYEAIYNKDGSLEWNGTKPPEQDYPVLEKEIHELMLFHVYDN
jgi:hypothetical protein